MLLEVGTRRLNAFVADAVSPAALQFLLDPPLGGPEVDVNDLVIANSGVAAMAEMAQLQAELMEQVLPVYPGHPEGRRLRSGRNIVCLDRVALHQRFGQTASRIVGLGHQGAVFGLHPAEQSDLSQCFFGSHGIYLH